MNKIHNILLGSAVLLTALAACSDHNEPETTPISPDRDAVTLDIHIEGAASLADATNAATTRADDGVEYRPLDGTELILIYGKAAASQPTATYKYSTDQWQLQSLSPLYWDDLTAAAGTPRYSFYAIANASFSSAYTDGSVPTNQGSVTGDDVAKNYNDADLMMAYSYTEKRQSPVPITLKHLMAQLTIELKNDPNATGDALFTDQQLKDATVTAKLCPEYSLAYSPIGNKTEADKATGDPATATAKAGASSEDFTLLRTVHYVPDADGTPTTKVAHVSFTCIAPPQALSSVTITIGGLPYTYTPAGLTLEAGMNTVQPLIAQKTDISLGDVKVTEWVDDPKESAPLTADGITPGSESLSGIDEAGTLSLYAYKTDDGTPATINPGVYPVTYNASSADGNKAAINKDAADYSPILWDNLAKYADAGNTLLSYTYAATYVPTGYLLANATNTELHEKDLLGSISVSTPWGTAPSFADASSNGNGGTNTRLKHLMARFTVRLTCTDGTYTAAELNAAKLTTVRKMIADPDAPLTVSNAGVTLNTADAPSSSDPDANKVTLVMTVAATDNTGAATDNIAQYSAILAPQTLTAAGDIDQTVLYLSISGAAGTKEYSLKKAVELIGGKDYILNATLSSTELSIGEISVEEWDKSITGDGKFEMQ